MDADSRYMEFLEYAEEEARKAGIPVDIVLMSLTSKVSRVRADLQTWVEYDDFIYRWAASRRVESPFSSEEKKPLRMTLGRDPDKLYCDGCGIQLLDIYTSNVRGNFCHLGCRG